MSQPVNIPPDDTPGWLDRTRVRLKKIDDGLAKALRWRPPLRTWARDGIRFAARDRGVIADIRRWIARARAHPLYARFQRSTLTADAWLDSSLYGSGRNAQSTYESFSMFMDRFHVTGLRRFGVELACEGITVSIAAGLFLLVLALPAFDLTSEDWIKKQDLAVTFLDRFGQEIGRRGIRHDDAVPFDELPPNLVHAVLATEDRRFFEHFGIDVIGTLRALTVNTRANGVVQGGSSLTQQLAKNLFLSNERTMQRKINEAFLALWLESHLSKREILSLYLDRAYLGGGTFGVQAASQFYFGKSVRDLTLPEAAMIAGLFKAPTKYAPHINLPAARARANDVLNNLVDAGYLSAGQIYAAQRNPATPVDRPPTVTSDWYLDYAYGEVKALAEEGKFGNERVLTVRLALDPGIQQHSEETIESQLRQFGTYWKVKQAATVLLEPTGALRAIVGGRDYGASQFNRATDALRQPGSSFKPYVYLTALMTGRFKPNTMISGASLCLGKDYCPHNYANETAGRLPLINALAMSLNTVAIRLSIEIGADAAKSDWQRAKIGRQRIISTARRMGITTPLPDTVSLPLGADAVKVIEQAGSYAGFANGGKRVRPYATVTVTNGRGDVIYDHDRDAPPLEQTIDPNAITMLNTMLRQVVLGGTGRAADIAGLPVAGKTGTTNGYHDAWFVGFTGNLVGAVWYGNDDYAPMREKMTGGGLPAQTWHQLMVYAHQNVEPKPVPGLPPPGPKVAEAAPPPNSGQTAAAPLPPQPVTLSKNSVSALGSIAESLHVAEFGRPLPPRAAPRAVDSPEPKRSDASSSRVVNLR